ncbi:hypothetical protein JHK84_043074 [Glycine max]|nr:hypothetical protein JHK84_043074 [Glycine max]
MAGQNQIWEHNLLDATTRVFSGDDYERNLNGSSKIIGAKYYKTDGFKIKDLKSPRDIDDHGTHIASTAAGNRVSMASMLGLGQGTSRGGATSTCIAVYKACWNDHYDDADILAAFDDAIADGVDILSVSLGGSNDQNYFGDASSIGAFHAMKNGIVTVFAAGNSSPSPAFVDNLYPCCEEVLRVMKLHYIKMRYQFELHQGNSSKYGLILSKHQMTILMILQNAH